MKRLKNRLRNHKGETIAEALVATLIAAMSIAMMAMVIETAAKTIRAAKEIRERNDAIVAAFWTDDEGVTESVVSGVTELDFGAFRISAGMSAYEVRSGEASGTVYEFR